MTERDAPPCGFTIASSIPRSSADCATTDANASLISTATRSDTATPASLIASRIAFDGCECSELSGPATRPWPMISAMPFTPRAFAVSGTHEHERRGAVGDLRGVARRDRAVPS